MRHIPRASNEVVAAYAATMVDELDQLARADPELCYAFLFPQQGPARDFGQRLEEATQKRDLEQLAQVIRSARTAPQPIPRADQAEPLLVRVRSRLAQDFDDDLNLLGKAQHAPGERSKVCNVARALYKQIGSLPVEQSGTAFRYLFGS
jgi:hypothetical protein